jgi:hypothetical protein
MSVDFNASRRVIEAQNIEKNDGPLGLDGHVSYSERIVSQPKERFRVPGLVKKAVSEDLNQELGEILEE